MNSQRSMDIKSSSRPLDNSRLYEVVDPLATRPYRLRSRLAAEALPDREQLQLLAQGKSAITEPIQFDAAQGREATDFLWTQLITPVCISESATRILMENKVSGWSTYPVEVFDQEGKLYPYYFGLAVTGAACEADYSRSAVVSKPPPTPRGRSYDVFRGLYFDEDQWDGSDMFWVGGVRVVVERVKEIFVRYNVRNVRFTPLAEREIRVRHVRRD